MGCVTSNWLDLQNNFSYGLNGSRNCCTCKLHVSLGILTYSNTASLAIGNTFPESMHIPDLCYTTRPWHFILAFTVVNTCSVELPAGDVHPMNNVTLTKWRIALKNWHRRAWESLKNSSTAKITISTECSTQWFMLFFRVWMIAIASTVIVLGWLTLKKESQKIDDLLVIATCQSGTSAMLSSEVNGPVVHGSIR